MSCSAYSTDQDYVRDIRTGGKVADQAADCLYRAYRTDVLGMVKSFLRYRSGIEDDALDTVQDAFLIMLEKIQEGGYKEGSLLHFWTGIARGLLRNKLKRDARMDLTDDNRQFDTMDTDSPEHLLIWHEQRDLLNQVLDRLGGRCKQVLLMWAGGYSMEEIASTLDLSSEAMARKTKYRCKNQLMAFIEEVKPDW